MGYSVRVNGFEKKYGINNKENAIFFAEGLIPKNEVCASNYKIDCSVNEVVVPKEKVIEVIKICNYRYGTQSSKAVWRHVCEITKNEE